MALILPSLCFLYHYIFVLIHIKSRGDTAFIVNSLRHIELGGMINKSVITPAEGYL